MGAKQRVKQHDIRETDSKTRLVESTLSARFPSAESYRSPFGTVRVRIIDERFQNRNRVQREKMVLPLIRGLPEEVQAEIVALLLLALGEEDGSIMNIEFDRPTRLVD